MGIIKWEDKMSVKVKEIDEQHKKLVNMINELHEAMLERKSKEALGKIIDGLIEYTDIHFKTEEKYFDKFGYPEADAHKKEHRDFVKKVVDFKKGYDEGKLLLSLDVMNFLKDWLVNHIMGSDQKYSDFFNQHGLH